jgi:hypothetical protein
MNRRYTTAPRDHGPDCSFSCTNTKLAPIALVSPAELTPFAFADV